VVNGTLVVLKVCNTAAVTQQWGIRESDGTIRLGNQNRCLTLNVPPQLSPSYTLLVAACVAGEPDSRSPFPSIFFGLVLPGV
jgi:hypothetical protein